MREVKNKNYNTAKDKPHILSEEYIPYGKEEQHEIENIRRTILMSDMERFRLFCKMMRIGKMLSSAKVTHYKKED